MDPDAPASTTDAHADAANDTVPADTTMPDAGFTVAACPDGYVDIGGLPGTRHRVISAVHNFWDHHDDCNDDGTATPTHLVVLDSQAEADLLAEIVGGRYFIGAAQAPGQSSKSAGWLRFDGGPMASAWAVNSNPSEPSDADGVEDGDEQVAIADEAGLTHDAGGVTAYRAVCECDGRPIDELVAIPPRP